MSVSSYIKKKKKLIPALETTKYYLTYKISSQIEEALVLNATSMKTNKVTVIICH